MSDTPNIYDLADKAIERYTDAIEMARSDFERFKILAWAIMSDKREQRFEGKAWQALVYLMSDEPKAPEPQSSRVAP